MLNIEKRRKQHSPETTILAVLSMMNEHPFVQPVINKKGQVPSIICHTEDQLVDFKHFLSRQGGTVGVDRTFNLGHFFVTILVYKNHRVVKNDTKTHQYLSDLFFYTRMPPTAHTIRCSLTLQQRLS